MTRTVGELWSWGRAYRLSTERHLTCTHRPGMCLTCGCMQAHRDMGPTQIRYEDLKAAADESGRSVADTLDIWERTMSKDRGEHAEEYGKG